MDNTSFIAAIAGMGGLLQHMIEQLQALSPQLTDDERADVLRKLSPINAQLEKDAEEMEVIIDEAMAQLEQVKHEELPKIIKQQEKAEMQAATSAIDELIHP